MVNQVPDASTVLTFNSGSSSLKFGLYRVAAGDPVALVSGEVETLGARRCRIRAEDRAGVSLIDETLEMTDPSAAVSRLGAIFEQAGAPAPSAVGHRVVHGGPTLRSHCLIDDAVLRTLDAAVCFAPLHVPPALAVIRYAREHFPGLPQAACFDTAFHADMPAVASTLPLPAALRARGIRRYGFHGLSCASIVRQLGPRIVECVVIAHLGNGASITAVKAGRSIDTSMGLTPSGGMIMGTRTGDIDPGILLYLLRSENLGADELEEVVDRRSGLAGLSGISSDVRRLNEVADREPDARLALEMFAVSAAKQIAGMIVALGGIEMLVFTGGIGENDPVTRARIVSSLAWCGVSLDREAARPGDDAPSGIGGGVRVIVLPSREDDEIARQTALIAAAPERSRPVPTR